MLQKTIEAYKIWHGYQVHIPKLSKYTLGIKIDNLFTDLIECLLLAGYAGKDQKAAFITRAATKLDSLQLFIQIAWEIKSLDAKKYGAISVPLHEVGKMIGGWKKSLN